MSKRKLYEITRLADKEIKNPIDFWALYADTYYENIFMYIDDRKELLDTYKELLKEVPPGKSRAALTFFYRLRRDELDNKLDWALVEQRLSNSLKLFENPDTIIIDRKTELHFSDTDAYAFGYFDGKMLISASGNIHFGIVQGRDRTFFKYSGRLWVNRKIISFWEYPPKNKMRKVLGDIEETYKKEKEKDLNLLSDPEWRIEIITEEDKTDIDYKPKHMFSWKGAKGSELIPLKDYVGSAERSPEELAKDHIMSPLEKAKRLTSKPSGYFKSKKRKPLQWKQAMYAESINNRRYINKNNKKNMELVPKTLNEYLSQSLNEDLGTLKKFDLPKDWIQILLKGGIMIGRESNLIDINFTDSIEIKKIFDNDDIRVVFLKTKEDGWRYMIKRETPRKYQIYDKHLTRDWILKNKPSPGYKFKRLGLLKEIRRSELDSFIKHVNVIDAQAIEIDMQRREKRRKRSDYVYKDVDPLATDDTWMDKLTPAQKARKEKYGKLKEPRLEMGLEQEVKKMKKQLIDNFENAIEKNIKDIKKGYNWAGTRDKIGNALLKGLSLEDFQKYVDAYDVLKHDYKDATDLASTLKHRKLI